MKGRNHKIRLSTPKTPEQRRKEDEVASRAAGIARWHASEQQPEQHALRLDLPAGVYLCSACKTVGEPKRQTQLPGAFFQSKRWCGGMRSVIEFCHADLGVTGTLVRDESGEPHDGG